jgi:TolA-binding protein
MTFKHILIIHFMIFWSFWLQSQQSAYYLTQDEPYQTAVSFYEKGNYGTAKEFFLRVSADEKYNRNDEIRANAAFYAAMCAIRLFHDDAEFLTNQFTGNYPDNIHVNDARFQLANYFCAVKKYGTALEYYQAVEKNKLSKDEQAEYFFNKGYCYFMKDDPESARVAFFEIKDLDTRYTPPAMYYYSHINYSQKNYQTALNGFLTLTNDETFGAIVPYYITDIYFLQKRYDKVIEFAPGLMEKVTEKRLAEVARIIGESYFQTGKYAEAIPYLEKYMEKAEYVTREDKYQTAYAYYKSGRYEEAADMFGKLSSGNSLLCQNALYHLADCYLKLERKNDARMAFASASKLDYDKNIQEDALFNYAMVTYELSFTPFNEAILALNQYIDKYPLSKRTDEAYNYLVMAYMTTKNYFMALNSLEKIKNKTPEMNKAYQKIAYYRALELINNLNYREAISMLNNSVKYGVFDNKLKSLSVFWKAEAYYRLGNYSDAIAGYRKFIEEPGVYQLSEYSLALYGIGYSCFQQQKFQEASDWFRKFVTQMNQAKVNTVGDALNRTGDCFFIRKDYYAAIDFYDRSIANGSTDVDYALFQKGLSFGVLDKEEQKIEVLNRLIHDYPASNFLDDALYETGESYVAVNQPEKAAQSYKRIIDSYPNSSYVSRALVNLGLIYYNTNRVQEAMNVYKRVIQDYPGTDEARGALSGLKNIYVDQNNVDGYFEYAGKLGSFAKVSEREQDSLSYISAENQYMSGDCEKSSQSFQKYIENHPEGSFILNAHFYKGDCNYQQKKYNEALASFDFVISKPRNIFTEQSLLGAARIAFLQENYAKARDYYKSLAALTETRGNLLEAKVGMMRCSYFLEDYSGAVDGARAVLEIEKLPEAIEREARFKLAKSLYAGDRIMLALEEFQKVATEVTSPEGAESKYLVAEIYFKRGDIKEADKVIADFAGKTTPHQYWMAMSFILWADIFAAQGDYFQAIQTLQSIIDYYGNSDDGVLILARDKYKKYVDLQQADEKIVKQQDIEIDMNK